MKARSNLSCDRWYSKVWTQRKLLAGQKCKGGNDIITGSVVSLLSSFLFERHFCNGVPRLHCHCKNKDPDNNERIFF